MDLDGFRSFVLDSGLDVWTWIDMAISLASSDYQNDLKNRRDGIIQKLYAPAFSKCNNCCNHHNLTKGEEEEEEEDCCKSKGIQENHNYEQKQDVDSHYNTQEKMESGIDQADETDDERGKVLKIKSLLDDQNQTERCMINLLHKLEDMDITLEVLKETDIGRHVTRLRKHSSEEVRRLVKILVRKWKDTVDEWVRNNTPDAEIAKFNDAESSHKKSIQNGKKDELPHGDTSNVPCCFTPQNYGKVKDKEIDSGHYSASRRGTTYLEAQNAKKQRTTKETKNGIVTNNRSNVPVKY